jgi:hypothetical protein
MSMRVGRLMLAFFVGLCPLPAPTSARDVGLPAKATDASLAAINGPHGPVIGTGAHGTATQDAESVGALPMTRDMHLLWSRYLSDPIYTTTGISGPTGMVLAGNYLNSPREAEAIPMGGSGTPNWVRPGTEFYVDAARGADVLAALDCTSVDSAVTVMEWRAASSAPLWTYRIRSCRPLTGEGWSAGKGIQVSDDGSTIAAIVNTFAPGGLHVRLVVFDAGSGTPVIDNQFADGAASALAITPDGGYIAIYAWPNIYVYDRYAHALRWSGSAGSGNDALTISPDGSYVSWGWNVLNVRRWDGSAYQSLWTTSHSGYYVTECAISSANTLAVAWYKSTFDDALVELYALPAHSLIWGYSYTEDASSLRHDEGGNASGRLPLPTDVISELVWSPDGSFLGASSWGPQFAEVHVWVSDQATPVGILDTPGTMFDIDVLSYTPEQAYVVACGKHVHAGTSGRGGDLYALQVLGSSDAPEDAGAPRAGRLSAYPNPANGPVRIDWSADARSTRSVSTRSAQLAVLDAQGRLVAMLRAADGSEGPSQAVWDGRDLAGRLVPAGVYLLRMDSGGVIATRRVVIAR